MRYISELRDGEGLIGFYFCKQKQCLKSKTGKNYYSLLLQDKTGVINAKVWDLNNNIQSFETGDYIKIDGIVTTFNNELQLNIKKIRRALEGEYDETDYIPSTKYDVDKMYEELKNLMDSIKNTYMNKLVHNIFALPQIQDNFKKHTAAKAMHHNYMGGLLEHTLSVAKICDLMASHYKNVNRDLLVTTGILHDVAKITEISSFPNIDYTDEGELLGHIVMGSELVGREADKIEGFPLELKRLIQHSILSHHGEFEYGSPKLPRTLEAFLLHCADDMDAKVKMFEDFIEADNTQGRWAGYNKILLRNIRKTEF